MVFFTTLEGALELIESARNPPSLSDDIQGKIH